MKDRSTAQRQQVQRSVGWRVDGSWGCCTNMAMWSYLEHYERWFNWFNRLFDINLALALYGLASGNGSGSGSGSRRSRLVLVLVLAVKMQARQ